MPINNIIINKLKKLLVIAIIFSTSIFTGCQYVNLPKDQKIDWKLADVTWEEVKWAKFENEVKPTKFINLNLSKGIFPLDTCYLGNEDNQIVLAEVLNNKGYYNREFVKFTNKGFEKVLDCQNVIKSKIIHNKVDIFYGLTYNPEEDKTTIIKHEIKKDYDIKEYLTIKGEYWDFDIYQNFTVFATGDNIALYENEKQIMLFEGIGGIARLDDIDGDNVMEMVILDSNGKTIYVYKINKGIICKTFQFESQNRYNDGILEIKDSNGDKVKEIYLNGFDDLVYKLILLTDGFKLIEEDRFVGTFKFIDYNMDGLMDIVVSNENEISAIVLINNTK